LKKMRAAVRGWRLNRQTYVTLAALAELYNPVICGWWNYYGAFYPTAIHDLYMHIDRALERWGRRKYKTLSGRLRAGVQWLRKMKDAEPQLFHHWRLVGNKVGADAEQKRKDHTKARVRAKVEWSFRLLKLVFGFTRRPNETSRGKTQASEPKNAALRPCRQIPGSGLHNSAFFRASLAKCLQSRHVMPAQTL
jgi:hypothetical protein